LFFKFFQFLILSLKTGYLLFLINYRKLFTNKKNSKNIDMISFFLILFICKGI
jgi:hypothetical protein